jgi:hypothetical protein
MYVAMPLQRGLVVSFIPTGDETGAVGREIESRQGCNFLEEKNVRAKKM